MNRRLFVTSLAAAIAIPATGRLLLAGETEREDMHDGPFELSEAEWRAKLTPAQYRILREEGTERPWSSPLLKEKRVGTYHCVGCDQALFSSETKYDSRTGWPSFYEALPDVLGTRRDFKLIVPRTEYHCARCGGHHGHVFEDGPKPTGLRYCNNGAVLRFRPASA